MSKKLLLPLSLLLLLSAGARAQETAPGKREAEVRAFAMSFGGGNYLGVQLENVTRAEMSRLRLAGEPRGALVTRVEEGSPAAKAGLRQDDVILRYDGEAVTSTQKLIRLVAESAPEHVARLTVSRGGAEQELTVTLGRRESFGPGELRAFTLPEGKEFRFDAEEWKKHGEGLRRELEKLGRDGRFNFVLGAGRRLGVTTTPLTAQLADFLGVADKSGLLVTSVEENSAAAKAGLKAGDVITQADGAKVTSAADLIRAVNRKDEGDVTLTVVRERRAREVRVTPERAPQPRLLAPGDRETFRLEAPSVALALPGVATRPRGLRALPRPAAPVTAPRMRFRPASPPVSSPRGNPSVLL